MCRKMIIASCSLLLCAVSAAGQSPGKPAGEAGTASTLIGQRMQFICSAYNLDDQQKKRLRADLAKLQGIHDAYMSKYRKTLRRQAKAISLVIPNQQNEYDEAMRASLTAKIQAEIYDIHGQAPLSLAAAVGKAEAMLSAQGIEGGRRKIAAKYATVLKGKPLNIKAIDRLVLKPIASSTNPAKPAFAPPAASVAKAKPVQRPKLVPKPIKIDRQTQGRTQPPATPPINRRTPPPPPGRVKAPSRAIGPLPPAPPTSDWAKAADAATAKYGFSSQQKLVAQVALESCLNRAESHLQKNKESLERARQAPPSDENKKRLAELQRPIDMLYHELNQRIDSIATIEQALDAKKKAQDSSTKK